MWYAEPRFSPSQHFSTQSSGQHNQAFFRITVNAWKGCKQLVLSSTSSIPYRQSCLPDNDLHTDNCFLMKRFSIVHHTVYSFSGAAQLLPHTLRIRPREGHELRIESSKLEISPPAIVRWHRDIEGNSVATAKFTTRTNLLTIKSEVLIQHFDLAPLDFLVAEHAIHYPFEYSVEERCLLAPYLIEDTRQTAKFDAWVGSLWSRGESIESFALLLRLTQHIFKVIKYRRREEEGVQSAEQTLAYGTGSCRDLAFLFMATARRLGIATRFVSGYLYSSTPPGQSSSTHAWAEALLPGAGWKGFDPTIGEVVGANHIAVAVARLPESVPPVAGRFYGNRGTTMTVDVWVSAVD